MANKYACASGLWSDIATWSDTDAVSPGAAVPADDDAVFIGITGESGVSVQMDVDLSAYTGLRTVTIRGHATTPSMIYQKAANGPGLRIGTTKPNVRTDRFSYLISGTFYSKAAVAAGTALSGNNIPQGTYGAWALDIGTDGTIDITPATDNATGYASSALAIAGLPAVAASHVRIGTVTAMHDDAVFVPGTTDLDHAGTTVAYANTAGATINYGYLKIRTAYNLVGTTVTNRGRLLANSDGIWGNTGALSFADKLIIDMQGTSKFDATNIDTALYDTEPTNKFARTYGTKYDFTAGSGTVDLVNNTIDLGVTPPSDNTAVMITTAAGTLPGGLEENCIYYISNISGTKCKLSLLSSDSTGLVDLTSVGSGTCTIFTGYASGSATVNVLDDVTSDTPWTTITGHNNVALVNAGPQNADQQRLTLTTLAAASIVLSTTVDSTQYPGARIYLVSRNVSIRSAGTTAAQPIVDFTTSTFTGSVFRCEIRNSGGTGTTFYGYGVNGGYGHTFSGVISGASSAMYGCNSCTMSGYLIVGASGLNAAINCTVSGTVGAYTQVFNATLSCTLSGTAQGCNYVDNTSLLLIIASTGITMGNSRLFYNSIKSSFLGICKCTPYIIDRASTCRINGTAYGCVYLSNGGQNNYGTLNITRSGAGTYLFSNTNLSILTLRGSNLSATPLILGRNTQYAPGGRLLMEDAGDVAGVHKIIDMYGDIIKTACDGTGDAPSVDPNAGHDYCIEVSNLQSNLSTSTIVVFDYEDIRVWATASISKIYTFKCQTTMTVLGTPGRLVLTASYLSNAVTTVRTEVTYEAGIAVRSNDSDWTQTVYVTINPAQTGWVNFRLELKYYESGKVLYVWPDPIIS